MKIAQPHINQTDKIAKTIYYSNVLEGYRQSMVFLYHEAIVDDFISQNPENLYTKVIVPVHCASIMKCFGMSRYDVKAGIKTLATLGYLKPIQKDSEPIEMQFTDQAVALINKANQPEVVDRELAKWPM